MMMITADGSARRSITLLLLDDYYSQVIIICGCDDESLWLSPTLYWRSVCRICVVPARSLRPRLMGVPSRDPLGLSLPLATVVSAPASRPLSSACPSSLGSLWLRTAGACETLGGFSPGPVAASARTSHASAPLLLVVVLGTLLPSKALADGSWPCCAD